ncbi:hybrid sensor histidine kinase/response regulator [Algihabitans albus]|uniref:hybrid sensor histidine kinase/response regulator n=1 Tax=Algihabitans albus TaxID=2164067 RepID=UPI0013C2BF2B|nr:ATP-binding protein [Algihabitans albus]
MIALLNRIRFRTKLPLLIAFAALLGGTAVGLISDRAATEQIKSSIDGQLRAHTSTRIEALRTLSESIARDLQVFKSSPAVSQALTSFVAGWTDLGADAEGQLRTLYVESNPHAPRQRDHLEHAEDASLYSVAHSFYHPRLRRHRNIMGYADLLLLSPEGLVLYSVAKANDFAHRIDDESFAGEPVQAAFLAARKQDDAPYVFTDLAETYRLGDRSIIGGVASALKRPDGALLGFLVFVIDVERVNDTLADGQGFGETGQTLLVGADGLLRSRLRSPQEPRVLQQAVEIDPVGWAIGGASGVEQIDWQPPGAAAGRDTIVAYGPADLLGVRYAVIAETPASEVFAPLTSMRHVGLAAGFGVLLVLAVLAFVLARAITQPLDRSTSALRRLMNGDLSVETPMANRTDEIGDLESAVAAFKSAIATREMAERRLRRAKEEADDANRAKSDFLAVMSHEVRTPLHGVLGLLDLIEEDSLTRRQSDALDRAKRSSQTLLGILNDILDLSKIEAGELLVANEAVDLRELARSVTDAYSGVALQKGLDLSCKVEPDVPARLLTDPLRLRQILWNLVNNAIKFTDAGAVLLNVRRSGERVVFCVSDTGIGIASESLTRLFEPFQQADASTTRRFGGTGLGLSISQRLAELLGGTIEAESELGRGARFSLSVPALAAEEQRGGASLRQDVRPVVLEDLQSGLKLSAEGEASPGPLRGRVLIAEDDPTGAFVLQQVLTREGYAATVARDGKDALRVLRDGIYDLLITDYHMPDLNGIDLMRQLRASPQSARLPIIALTADARESATAKCRAAGASVTLTKPVAKGRLVQTIGDLIGGAKARPVAPAEERGDPDDEEFAVFDPAYLREIFASFEEARGTIDEFLEDMSGKVERAAQALAAEAESELAAEAHRAASACFFMGAMRLGACWRALETAASDGDLDGGASQHAELVRELSVLRREIGRGLLN